MNLKFTREIVELTPKDPTLSPFCKKCHGNIYRQKGDLCYRCYEEHCAFRESVLFRQLVSIGKCSLCSEQVPVNYKESDIGAVCLTCFSRHESIFKWSYDEKRKFDRYPTQPKYQAKHRCTMCKKYFEDLSIENMTLCKECFTKKYDTANSDRVDDDSQPPVLEKMEKKKSPTRRAPRKRVTEAKKDVPYRRPSPKIIAQLNKKSVAAPVQTLDSTPVAVPAPAPLPNTSYAENNYQPAPDNSFDWYSQPAPYQQQEVQTPISTQNQSYPEHAYPNNVYQNVYNGSNGYIQNNGYNGYNHYNGYQQDYPQMHPSWNQEYTPNQNYGNYNHNYQ